MAVLEELKKLVDDHFWKEMNIAVKILEADMTDEEFDELNEFMRNHEWAKLNDELKISREKRKGVNIPGRNVNDSKGNHEEG